MYLLLYIFILIAIIQPGMIFPEIAKYRPFLIITIISLISLILSSYNKKIFKVVKSDQAIFLFGLMGCEVLGYLITERGYISGTIGVWFDWMILFIIFLMPVILVDSCSIARKMLWVIVLSSSYLFWKSFYILKNSPGIMEDGRLGSYGMYNGANDFALILVIVFPIVFKLFYVEKSIVKKSFLILLMLLIPYLLVNTASRGGMLGFASVFTLSMLWDDKTLTKTTFLKRCLKLSPLLLFFFVIGFARLALRDDAQSYSIQDASAAHRIVAWKAGLHMMLDSPWGIGYGNFVQFAKQYGAGHIQAHNTIIKVGAEAGFLGLFCYISLIYSNFKHLFMLHKTVLANQDRQGILIVQALGISLVGFFICTQFSVKEYEYLLFINLSLTSSLVGIYGLPRIVFTGRDAFIVLIMIFLFFVFVKILPA